MASVKLSAFPEPETFDCPHCHELIKLHDPDGSDFCVCRQCNSYIRFINNTFPKVQKQAPKAQNQPLIPIGTEGIFREHKFKVIAYFERKEKGTKYCWQEFLLYNFEKGYATLAVFDGHWNFVIDKGWEPTLRSAYSDSGSASCDGVDYRVFNKYTPVTIGVAGEFDWDVLEDSPKTNEYIAPPYILYRETGSAGTKYSQYYLGEYIEADEIAQAFNIDIKNFPEKIGIGASQLSPFAEKFTAVIKVAILSILAVIGLHMLIKTMRPERILLNSNFDIQFVDSHPRHDSISAFSPTTPSSYDFKPFVTSSFEQPDENAALDIKISSYVDNNWLETSIILVNEKTNATWEITKGIEYYHGYEDGEYWTEGSINADITLTEIPKGKYHLNIYPASGNADSKAMLISVVSNITLFKNIFLAIALICLYPIYCWLRISNFERKRWMNSDYSPYEVSEQ